MRNQQCHITTHARRSGDRIDVANEPNLTEHLSAEVIRLARLATSIHLAEQARLMATAAPDATHSSSKREITQ